MKPHKWAKEIKAWADGAEIEWKLKKWGDNEWLCIADNPKWDDENNEYRIKPQPKEPQYLYAYFDSYINRIAIREDISDLKSLIYKGKIKLEVDE